MQTLAPSTEDFRRDVLRGLRLPQKRLPSKYFYDARGAQLFDRICELEEYYPTRTELSIMRRWAGDMAARLGRRCLIAEYGSGSGLKTRYLLAQMIDPAGYVPIDISQKQLQQTADDLDARFPSLEVVPVCADFTDEFDLPRPTVRPARTVIYFPGSTIGNFDRSATVSLLDKIVERCGEGGALLIGIDLKKNRAALERAYNDASGVTADFNLNLLHRINRELDADIPVGDFDHKAIYNAEQGRIEMHLVSREAQVVEIEQVEIPFERGETICTEYSYKYDVDEFQALAKGAGLTPDTVWTDVRKWFAVFLMTV